MARRSTPAADLTPTILAALRETPGLHSQVLALALDVEIEAVRVVLLQLEREGQARREGATRGTRWFPAGSPRPTSPQAPAKPDVPAAQAKAPKSQPAVVTAAPEASEPRRSSPKTAMLDKLRDEIGTVPDAAIAKRAGVSTELVRQYRKKHSIPSMQDSGISRPPRASKSARPIVREAQPLAIPSAPLPSAAAPPARGSVWKVSVGDGQTRYVLGTSIAEAASNTVARAGTSQITSIEWFADLWDLG